MVELRTLRGSWGCNMSILKVLVPLAAAGAGLFLLSSNANASTSSDNINLKTVPPALLEKMNKALDSADPETLRKVAIEVEARGFKPQADTLRKAAEDFEKAAKAVPPIVAPSTPGGSTAQTTSPATTGTAKTPAEAAKQPDLSPERQLAGRMALNLTQTVRPNENRGLVSAFQQQEAKSGFYVGKIDGLYGTKSAIALGDHHNIIPPTPRYYPRDKAAAAKVISDYKKWLAAKAAADPSRAEEWTAAGKNVGK